jgi:1-acyl-sn-glycerol-3-phosphate acyltransferase
VNLAATIQNIVRALMRALYKIEVSGAENIPSTGPVILCANHSGLIDGVVLLLAGNRPLTVVAKYELFRPPFGVVFSAGDGIPIDWKSPDRDALKMSVSAVLRGKVLGIFPEGTRCRGQYDWLKDGVTYVLVQAAHQGIEPTVVPVTILGTRPTGKSKSYFTKFGTRIVVDIAPALDISSIDFRSLDPTNRREIDIAGERLRLMLEAQVRLAEQRSGIQMPEDDVSDYRERLV